jgi:hypothetical protein
MDRNKLGRRTLFFSLGKLGIGLLYLIVSVAPSFLLTLKAKAELSSVVRSDVRVPEWEEISFSSLGSVGESGEYEDRAWQAGDSLARILNLDDISEDFAPQKFQVGEILELAGKLPERVSLEDFPLVGKQTLKDLVVAVPNLGDLSVTDVTPIAELLDAEDLLATDREGDLPNLGELVQNPEIGELTLNKTDLLDFSIDSIPNLESAAIQDFNNWQQEKIADIPGLSEVPLARMSAPMKPTNINTGVIARIDAVWSKEESDRQRTISGSNRVGFNYPCKKDCAYIELDDLENVGESKLSAMEGVQWISGKYQKVKGGSGCLKGKEPTGRHPFGKAFKVVVWEPSERDDTVDTKIFFRFKLFCGKSPYILGPFPFLNYRVNDLIYLGPLDLGINFNLQFTDSTNKETSTINR